MGRLSSSPRVTTLLIPLPHRGRGQQLSWVSSILSEDGGPAGVMFKHGIENGQQLAHARGEGELGRFAGGAQAAVEGGDDGIMARGDKGAHVEHSADVRTATPDCPAAAKGGRETAREDGPPAWSAERRAPRAPGPRAGGRYKTAPGFGGRAGR